MYSKNWINTTFLFSYQIHFWDKGRRASWTEIFNLHILEQRQVCESILFDRRQMITWKIPKKKAYTYVILPNHFYHLCTGNG